MVRYEFAVILRAVGRPQLADTFKLVAKSIISQGAVLRKLVNLGERQLPYRMKAHSQHHTHGRYMLCDVEAGPDMAIKVKENIKKISDVIRVSMITSR